MLHQTFQPFDLVVVGLLVILEGVLSIDNALVLGILARRLPRGLQSRALTIGLIGAFVFRLVAIALAVKLLQWRIVKLLGGAYLIFVAVRDLFFKDRSAPSHTPPPTPTQLQADAEIEQEQEQEFIHETHGISVEVDDELPPFDRRFWSTVTAIELTDIAFATDSILAAIALVGPPPHGTPPGAIHPKLWVIVTGGMLGVVLMRVAAVLFIRLLERFPRFEMSAYLLVLVVGLKLAADYFFNAGHDRLDFQSPVSPAFWTFWALMLLCFGVGFLPPKPSAQAVEPLHR